MQMQKEYFPIGLQKMGAQFEFYNFGEQEKIYGAILKSVEQHHIYPGGSYGFRIDDEDVSLVICTDVEHINGIDKKVVKLAKNADLLIHDGQYTPEEYKKFKGWGHSTWEHAVEVAMKAKVKKLIITHHDPDHNDDFLDTLEGQCKKSFPNSVFAKEGMELVV